METIKKAGRPKSRPNDEQSRENLLDAAARLFSQNGMAATSLAKVAAGAGLSSAMIHYYFKNKDQLIQAVAEERLARFLGQVIREEDYDDHAPLAEYFQSLIHRLNRACEEHPWVPQLWVREIISEGGGFRGHILKLLPRKFFRRVAERFAAEQPAAKGDGIEPALLFFTAISNFLLPLAASGLVKGLPGLGHISGRRAAAHAAAVIEHGFFGADIKSKATGGGRRKR